MGFEKLFEGDVLTKRERVERTINFQPVDRVAIHEQLSYNPRVIEQYTGKTIRGYEFTAEDVGKVVQKTLDATFPMFTPYGRGTEVKPDGFVYTLDDWTKWIAKRPFEDEDGACQWLEGQISQVEDALRHFDKDKERAEYHAYMMDQQRMAGETVIIDWSIATRFSEIFDKMGLEIFTYFYYDNPEVMKRFISLSTEYSVRKVLAAGDNSITPVVLIAEDFCTRGGPIFQPEILNEIHYPYIRMLTDAWHEKGLKVIYHTDGNFKKVIPNLMDCHVDGFYCLERNCGMHIEELKSEYPNLIWAGGLDGIDVLEFGTPEDVRQEALNIIRKTNAVEDGGIFLDSSSEINPPIPVENFTAMLQAADEARNTSFSQ